MVPWGLRPGVRVAPGRSGDVRELGSPAGGGSSKPRGRFMRPPGRAKSPRAPGGGDTESAGSGARRSGMQAIMPPTDLAAVTITADGDAQPMARSHPRLVGRPLT